MDFTELIRILNEMENIIKFSFRNELNIHSSIGGKYGELYVAKELMQHEPLLGKKRDEAKNVQNPRSADIVLKKTGKKIEVKWGALHYKKDDYYFRTRGRTEYWGWGFSKGTQFLKDKFDYCVLLCAERDGARPVKVYVVTAEEMRKYMEKRVSGEGGKNAYSFFVEVSENPNFFERRKNQKRSIKPCQLEFMIQDSRMYEERWEELKKYGRLIKI